ncbi:hypothetical protein Y032_0242g3446 [Ancylostoma ceylanicum]|uniref:Uncharacterized protein n=1 Tax=Ancylostoma ceylanicum TaxID=53326 RepID=A0A016SDK3_9BILA|nr:hypothetical protein Y032_0242g3446 [Ancylostoma ceylanicum]
MEGREENACGNVWKWRKSAVVRRLVSCGIGRWLNSLPMLKLCKQLFECFLHKLFLQRWQLHPLWLFSAEV